ncbi:uncharacterized protein [Blastocystis hominis]|uniref:ribose-phosphate diphosphokinase n=1 Tax=Blastocystis hominis TaxID=12968 RepID=D8M677_BLAHO|nr:uncharacterized protein [Blastocystis hominis]CBK23630.2 unnamed protein product [Blastocystis hominis]|eukprot:XP_012897678.1 uncharacterized protein [Blastocystis hominis]
MFAGCRTLFQRVARSTICGGVAKKALTTTIPQTANKSSLLFAAGGLVLASFVGYQTFKTAYADSPAQSREAKNKAIKSNLRVFSGSSNRPLAEEIVKDLGTQLGSCRLGRFADGEVVIDINEDIRGKDLFIVQSTCPPNINDNLMELMMLISTSRRASARRITAVIPYYGYARQDRKVSGRVPISAADVARLLEAMGVDRVVAVDLHCGQIQGFFGPRVPVDNLQGGVVGVDYFAEMELHKPVIVSPDAGGVYRVKKFRDALMAKHGVDAGVAMIIKQRAKPGLIESMDLVGTIEDSDCIIVDDMIDTAGTLCKAANQLKEHGARRVFAFASHGLFSKNANQYITDSVLEQVVVLNTIPLSASSRDNKKIVQLSVAPLLADTIRAIHGKQSVSEILERSQ